jgi:hypothetical protein
MPRGCLIGKTSWVTRYDKLARNFRAGVLIAAAVTWKL